MKRVAVVIVAIGISLSSLGTRDAQAAIDVVEITFTTTPTSNPRYYPRNIVAVWLEDQNQGFVRTFMRFAQRRVRYLIAWNGVATDSASLSASPDAITGATRSSHGSLSGSWLLVDADGNPLPDGQYTVRMELTDHDSSSASSNNQGTFTFEKNGTASEVHGLSSGGFEDVSIIYTPNAADPVGTIPGPGASCAEVIECVDGDGCCPSDCVFEVDADCDPGTAREPSACSAGGDTGQTWLLGAGVLLASLLLRRRRAAR